MEILASEVQKTPPERRGRFCVIQALAAFLPCSFGFANGPVGSAFRNSGKSFSGRFTGKEAIRLTSVPIWNFRFQSADAGGFGQRCGGMPGFPSAPAKTCLYETLQIGQMRLDHANMFRFENLT